MNFSDHNDWSKWIPIPEMGIANDETNDNLDLFVVPRYERKLRNPDHTG